MFDDNFFGLLQPPLTAAGLRFLAAGFLRFWHG
jgi:hypothetical protein